MKKHPACCPYCKHVFTTRKMKDIQCSACIKRFDIKDSCLDLEKNSFSYVKKQHGEQINKIEGLLDTLSIKYEETGTTIQEIRKITKESIQK